MTVPKFDPIRILKDKMKIGTDSIWIISFQKHFNKFNFVQLI